MRCCCQNSLLYISESTVECPSKKKIAAEWLKAESCLLFSEKCGLWKTRARAEVPQWEGTTMRATQHRRRRRRQGIQRS